MLTARPSRSPNEADAPRLIVVPGTPARRPASVDLAPPLSALAGEIDAVAVNLLAGLRANSDFSAWCHGVEWERFAELTAESLRSQLAFLPDDAPPSSCLAVDVEIIDSYLTEPADLRHLLRWQRLCQGHVWDSWCGVLEQAADLTPAVRGGLLARGSTNQLRYADLFGERAAETQGVLLAPLGAPTPNRFQAIKQFLDGGPIIPSWVDFDLDRHHLAIVAWGPDHGALARRLAELMERPILAVDTPDRATTWAWVSGVRPLPASGPRRLEVLSDSNAHAALGLDLPGPTGFQASHRQAERARRLAAHRDSPVIRYEDLAVELLLSENEEEARTFLGQELAGIDDDSASSRRIRETISAYFVAEHNAASAAAALGIHQQTVANRLRVAEERLGHPVGARRVELEVALRLRAVLTRDGS